MRIVLLGYYGYGNVGDEAGLGVILERLRGLWPGANLTVISGHPAASEKLHGVEAISRFDLPRLRRRLKTADLFLLGGGGLLQDTTSLRSLLYYLAMIRWANRAGAPVVLYGQGIGPLRRPFSRRLMAENLRLVRLIAVRDPASAQLLRDLGLGERLRVGSDPVFSQRRPEPGRGKAILAQVGLAGQRLVGIAPRRVGPAFFWRSLAEYLRWLEAQAGLKPVLLSFQSPQDDWLVQPLERELGHSVVTLAGLPPEDFLAVIGELELLVGVRLHSLVMAASMGTPFLGVAYDPKVDAMLAPFGLQGFAPGDFRPEVAGPRSLELLARREEIGRELQSTSQSLTEGEEGLWREIQSVVTGRPVGRS